MLKLALWQYALCVGSFLLGLLTATLCVTAGRAGHESEADVADARLHGMAQR